MNIFWLDLDVERSAKFAMDQHIVKMQTEHTQQMATILTEFGLSAYMRPTHSGHPCVRWLAEDFANFVYLYQLNGAYFKQYALRYTKREGHGGYIKGVTAVMQNGWSTIRRAYRAHGADRTGAKLKDMLALPHEYITVPPQAIPVDVRVALTGDRVQDLRGVVKAYRRCYQIHKSWFARYHHSDVPAFMADYVFFFNRR
jgi:hypothetical protein